MAHNVTFFRLMFEKLKNKLKQYVQKVTLKRVAKVLTVLAAFYFLFAYFAVNPIAKRLVPWIAERSLASQASVDSVRFDPLRLKTTVNGFKLSNPQGELLAQFNKLVVDFEVSGMFDFAWKFDKVGVAEPQLHFAISPSGQMNWDALIAKLNEGPEKPRSDTITSVIIEHIVVKQGLLRYVDANRPNPVDTSLTPLNFQLDGFSTLARDRGDYFVSAALANGGGVLKWKGSVGINPVASDGVVALDGVRLTKALALIKGFSPPMRVTNGDAQMSFGYNFSMPKSSLKLALKNVVLGLNDVLAESADGRQAKLTHIGFATPTLNFTKHQQAALALGQVNLKLMGLDLDVDSNQHVSLVEAVATLPALEMKGQALSQPSIAGLNMQLSGLNYKQAQQFAVAVPQVVATAIGFDAAQQQVNIQDVAISEVQLAKSQKQPIATLAKATLANGQVALKDKKVTAASVLFSGLKTSVVQEKDGVLNWAALFAASENSKVKTKAGTKVQKSEMSASKEALWDLQLAKVAIDKAEVQIQDKAVAKPVTLDIEQLALAVDGVSLDMTKALPVNASFKVKQGGQFSAKGQLWPAPFKTNLGVRLSQLSLKPFAPYLNQVALLKLKNGAVNLSGKVKAQQKQKFSLAFNGGVNVKRLAILEEVGNKPFLSWNSLGSRDVRLALMPNKLQIKTLKIEKPAGEFIINEDNSTNFSRVLRQPSQPKVKAAPKLVNQPIEPVVDVKAGASLVQAAAPKSETEKVKQSVKAATTPSAPAQFPVQIDTIRVHGGKLAFADLSLKPKFGAKIHALNGVVNGLSTNVEKTAQVEMDGKVNEYGSARISGQLQPFNATDFTDIKLVFKNLDMNRLTPYSGKFAGRRIESGRLSVDLAYHIEQQQLTGENNFVIKQIKLGENVESEEAANLPLDLAIAILEDGDGVIDLDLPVSGSLDDPSFSYSGIFWQAFKNVLTKIVTAPFKVLGKLFGGDGEDFDGIVFEAGMSQIAPAELEKLAKVSEALEKRRGLSIGVVPSYTIGLDKQAIQEMTYRQQVMDEKGIELEKGRRPDPVDLTNEKTQDAIDVLYNKLTKKGLLKRMVSKLKKPEDGHYEKAQAALIASVEVTDSDLQQLSAARANAIQEVLLANGVSAERVSIAADTEAQEGEHVKTPLTLDVKR